MAGQLGTLLRSRVSLVWLGLIIATMLSWTVGTDHGLHAHLATTIVLLVAFTKVRFVGLYFMELRDSAIQLRALFECYCAAVCAALIVMLFAAGS